MYINAIPEIKNYRAKFLYCIMYCDFMRYVDLNSKDCTVSCINTRVSWSNGMATEKYHTSRKQTFGAQTYKYFRNYQFKNMLRVLERTFLVPTTYFGLDIRK